MVMKIALLGAGFGQAHAAVYQQRSDVDEVVVFGRTLDTLARITEDFGFTTTTDLESAITDPATDLVDARRGARRAAAGRPPARAAASCMSLDL
jgi:predicted dehydrogenase